MTRRAGAPELAPAWEATAPGKLILFGEHAVVYGAPALAIPLLGHGVTVSARPVPRLALDPIERLPGTARRALLAALAAGTTTAGAPPLRFTVSSALPVSAGLGSSGALSVAAGRVLRAAALGAPVERPADRSRRGSGRDEAAWRRTVAQVEAIAHAMERTFHGRPSGVDQACSARAEPIVFRAGAEGTPRVRALHPGDRLGLLVALAGHRGRTRDAVLGLAERRGRWPARYARVVDEIGRVAEEGVRAFRKGDRASLGDLMNVNQGLLAALGVSSARIDALLHRLRALGALGAKLTGAGGSGGAVVALFERPDLAARRLRRDGVTCFVETLGDGHPGAHSG